MYTMVEFSETFHQVVGVTVKPINEAEADLRGQIIAQLEGGYVIVEWTSIPRPEGSKPYRTYDRLGWLLPVAADVTFEESDTVTWADLDAMVNPR